MGQRHIALIHPSLGSKATYLFPSNTSQIPFQRKPAQNISPMVLFTKEEKESDYKSNFEITNPLEHHHP